MLIKIILLPILFTQPAVLKTLSLSRSISNEYNYSCLNKEKSKNSCAQQVY